MAALRAILEDVYASHGDQLYRCALAVTGCNALAEDAVHNAFAKAMRLTDTPQNPKAYLLRSVRNAAIDLMRRESRTVPISSEMIFEVAPNQFDSLDRHDRLQQVADALNCLNQDERETLLQHLVSHLTFQEIADLRVRPLPTITSWYRRGLQKLKQHLPNEERPI